MMKRVLSFLAIALTLFVVNTGAHAVETVTMPAPSLDPENTLYMDLPFGRVVIALRPDKAPKTVARIKELVRMGFYDGSEASARHDLHGSFIGSEQRG